MKLIKWFFEGFFSISLFPHLPSYEEHYEEYWKNTGNYIKEIIKNKELK
jgi:hypothetical protein